MADEGRNNMNSSWFRKLLLSYLPVFVVVVTILFVVFFQSLSEQNRKQAVKANEFLAEQAIRITDNSLKALDYQILRATLSSSELKRFFGTNSNDVYGSIQANKLMDDWKLNYAIIDSAYLIRLKDQFILGDGSAQQSKFLDQSFIQPYIEHRMALGEWSGKRSFKPYTTSVPSDVITYVQGYPQFSTVKQGFIVVNVSLAKLKQTIAPMYNPNVTFVQFNDSQGGILMNDGDKLPNKRGILANYVSTYTGWKAESGLVSGTLSEIALDFYSVWVIIAFAVVLLGVIWVVHITRRNYKPISQLVSLIRTSALIKPDTDMGLPSSNEFGFIQGALEQLMEETTKTRQKNKETIILQKKHRFQEVVEGAVPIRETEWQTDLIAFHIQPAGTLAFMLELEIDRYAQFIKRYQHQDQSMLKFVVSSVTQEIATMSGASVWAEWIADRRMSAIVWVPDDSEGTALSVLIGEQIVEWVRGNLSFSVTIGVHGMACNLEEIRRSHEIARDLLHYKAVLGMGRLLDAAELESRSHDFFGTIQALAQAIRLAEGGWRKSMDELFSQMTDAVSSRKEIESFMQFLHQQLKRMFLELPKDYRNVWKDTSTELLELLADWETLDELKQGCTLIFEAAAAKLTVLKDSQRTRAVIGDIRSYIEDNYPNPELSLDHLSDKFAISAKNISKLFKEESGCNFVDFLIGLRMDKAKLLLLSTDQSLQEISGDVGYFNYNSFNRAFKNVAGMSPSDYRKQQAAR
jgi:AraC-like DNA-binding protein